MTYKIAVTSSDGAKIDLHFGQAKGFYVFQVDAGTGKAQLIGFRKIPDAEAVAPESGLSQVCNGRDAARVAAIVKLLDDCRYILTDKIGLFPYRILKRAGISSMEIPGRLSDIVPKLNLYYLKQLKMRIPE